LGNIFYVGGYYFDYVNYEKLDSSIENYWSAVRFGYVNDSLIDGLLRCYHWESDLNLKKESLTKLTSLNPNHINVLYNRAEARKELAKFQLAVEDYERVKSLDIENHFDYHLPYYTGHMHYLLGDSIKSKQYFERALKMSKRLTLRPYDDWAKNVKMWEENNKVN
jgi:tetratricopeptide (TPR) repeat protein